MDIAFALADRENAVVFRLSEESKGIRLHHTKKSTPPHQSPVSIFGIAL
jgi:hypothetical protein